MTGDRSHRPVISPSLGSANDFCTELLQNRSVSDATYARAVAKFGEQGILDSIGLMGHYSLIGMVLNTARTPVAPGGPPPLERFPR